MKDTANVLKDAEWKALVDECFKIARATTHEDLRMTTLRALRRFIPFQSAVFFLVDPAACEIVDCIIVQPLGEDLSSEEYERFMRKQWAPCDDADGATAEGSATGTPSAAGLPTASRVYFCRGSKTEKSHPHYFDDCHMLACDIADERGVMGSLALTRNNMQDEFTERDKFVLEVLEPHLTNELAAMYGGGRFETLNGKRLREHFALTNREIEVTECVRYGMTTPEIAHKLGISTHTAKKHLENIYRKVGVNNRMSLMKLAENYLTAK